MAMRIRGSTRRTSHRSENLPVIGKMSNLGSNRRRAHGPICAVGPGGRQGNDYGEQLPRQ